MSLSVVIIAKNEEKLIPAAIKSARFANEVLVVDTGSTDKTVAVAKKLGARVVRVQSPKLEFARWRTIGARKAKGEWIFYLDADERITIKLRDEVMAIVNSQEKNSLIRPPRRASSTRPRPAKRGCGECGLAAAAEAKRRKITAYAVPRANYYLGKRVWWGGAWPDYVKRLFWKPALKKWVGVLHEEPVFEGELGHLKNPLLHFTHRDLTSMLEKTIEWSKLEAEELYRAGHPPVTWWRILRVMATEFWQRGIKKQGFRDGTVGIIEVIYQMFSRFITYARLWERQNS